MRIIITSKTRLEANVEKPKYMVMPVAQHTGQNDKES